MIKAKKAFGQVLLFVGAVAVTYGVLKLIDALTEKKSPPKKECLFCADKDVPIGKAVEFPHERASTGEESTAMKCSR